MKFFNGLAIAAAVVANLVAGVLAGKAAAVFRIQAERVFGGQVTLTLSDLFFSSGSFSIAAGAGLALFFVAGLSLIAWQAERLLPIGLSVAFVSAIMQLTGALVFITLPYVGLKDERTMQEILAKEISWGRGMVWLTDGKTTKRREVPDQAPLQAAFLSFEPSRNPVGDDLMTLTFASGSAFPQQCFDVAVDSNGNGYFARRGFPKTRFFSKELANLFVKARVVP